MERDYGCRDNSPDWPRFRYEPQRHHSPKNEGHDHRGYITLEYNKDGHRNSYEYGYGHSLRPHIDGYRRTQRELT